MLHAEDSGDWVGIEAAALSLNLPLLVPEKSSSRASCDHLSGPHSTFSSFLSKIIPRILERNVRLGIPHLTITV